MQSYGRKEIEDEILSQQLKNFSPCEETSGWALPRKCEENPEGTEQDLRPKNEPHKKSEGWRGGGGDRC